MEKTEQRYVKTGPPRILETIARVLTPRACRTNMVAHLDARHTSTGQSILDAILYIWGAIELQVRRSFNGKLLGAEAATLLVAFAGESLSLAVVLTLAVALGSFVLRDAHTHQSYATAKEGVIAPMTEAAVDVAAAVACILFLQLVGFLAPTLSVLPTDILIRGIGVSVLILLSIRLGFRLNNTPSPEMQRHVDAAHRATWTLNAVWVLGCMALVYTNHDITPAIFPARDFLLAFLPFVSFGIIATQNRGWEGLPGRDPVRHQLKIKRDWLWVDPKPGFSLYRASEIAFFGLLGWPLVATLIEWLAGSISTDEVEWFRFGANLAAFPTLLLLWIFGIKKSNQTTARILQDEIDRLR